MAAWSSRARRADGSRVRSFGHNGHVVTPGGIEGASALAVDIDRRGRIISGGYKIDLSRDWTAMVLGYRPDGSLDSGFGDRGIVEFQARHHLPAAISGIGVLPGGKILAGDDLAGRLLLARLLPDGRPDRTFGGGDGTAQTDGRITAAGFFNSRRTGEGHVAVLRYLPNGRLDRSFADGGFSTVTWDGKSIASAAITQPDGRVVVGGPCRLWSSCL